jgi:hypothetical protein
MSGRKKLGVSVSIIILLAIFALQVNQTTEFREFVAADQAWKDSISHEIAERAYTDSLYYDHLSQCSFIDRKSVRVDKYGRLYSHYHKYDGTR